MAEAIDVVNGALSFQTMRLATPLRGFSRPSSYVPISSFSRQAMMSFGSVMLAEERVGRVNAAAVAERLEDMVLFWIGALLKMALGNVDVVKRYRRTNSAEVSSQRPGSRSRLVKQRMTRSADTHIDL